MVKSLISWAVAGLFIFAWYWAGYVWPFIQDSPRGSWGPTWVLITILVILLQRRGGVAAVGANVVETITSRVKTIVSHILGLIVALSVGVTAWSLYMGSFMINEYLQGIAVIVSCSIITSIMLGALDDASQ